MSENWHLYAFLGFLACVTFLAYLVYAKNQVPVATATYVSVAELKKHGVL